uniref:Uncharacterized protein MANES_10G091900 n=1 Tax=Rhizophora mucronata TaxID=61149 RepID=A0A2P2LF00_RHIMU
MIYKSIFKRNRKVLFNHNQLSVKVNLARQSLLC